MPVSPPAREDIPASANPAGIDADVIRKLGAQVVQEIEASDDARGPLLERYKRNFQLYNIDPNCSNLNLLPGMATYPMGLWKAKADRITSFVIKAMTSIEPYCQLIPESEKPEDRITAQRLSRAIQSLSTFDDGKYGFDRALRGCLDQAINCGLCFMYIHPSEDGQIIHEVVAPPDFMAYPHEQGSVKDCKTVGHRYWKMRSEIVALMKAGEYMDVPPAGTDTFESLGSTSRDFAGVTQTQSVDPDDELNECWQVVRRCDLGKGLKDYIISVLKTPQQVVRIEELPYQTSRMYFELRFSDSYGSIWPASSPGNDMQALQILYTDLINTLLQGGFMNAWPLVCLIGGTLKQKETRITPGALLQLPSGVQVTAINNQFNGQYLVELLPIVEKLADAITRISELGVTQPLKSNTSGTEAASVMQARQEGKDAYTQYVMPVIGEIWVYYRELLTVHFKEIKNKHGDLGLKGFNDVKIKCRFEPTGKSDKSNPVTQLQNLQFLAGLAQNPHTTLDYNAIEEQIINLIDLACDPELLKKQGPNAQELLSILRGLLLYVQSQGHATPEQGAVTPDEVTRILSEATGQGTAAMPQGQPDAQGQGQPQDPMAAIQQGGSPLAVAS